MGLAFHAGVGGLGIGGMKKDMGELVGGVEPCALVVGLSSPSRTSGRVPLAQENASTSRLRGRSRNDHSVALDEPHHVLNRFVAQLPKRPDAASGGFGRLGIVIGVECQIGGRLERRQRHTTFDLGDKLGEQTGVGGGAFAVALGRSAETAEERRVDGRQGGAVSRFSQKRERDVEHERELGERCRARTHGASFVLADGGRADVGSPRELRTCDAEHLSSLREPAGSEERGRGPGSSLRLDSSPVPSFCASPAGSSRTCISP